MEKECKIESKSGSQSLPMVTIPKNGIPDGIPGFPKEKYIKAVHESCALVASVYSLCLVSSQRRSLKGGAFVTTLGIL